MFQRRSIVLRVFTRLRQMLLSLLAFFLLQYLIFSVPLAVAHHGLMDSGMWPIAFLIAIVYAAAAIVSI